MFGIPGKRICQCRRANGYGAFPALYLTVRLKRFAEVLTYHEPPIRLKAVGYELKC